MASKRAAPEPSGEDPMSDEARAAPPLRTVPDETTDNLTFEDPYEDEVGDDDEMIVVPNAEDEEAKEEGQQLPLRTYRPGIDPLPEGSVLDYDATVYQAYHKLHLGLPCLSFDFVRDRLGEQRERYPHTLYFVAGTQATGRQKNKLYVCRASEIHRTRNDDGTDSDDDVDDLNDLDDDAALETKFVLHNGVVNRVRAMPQRPNIVATWSDQRKVYLWDVAPHLAALEPHSSASSARLTQTKPLFGYGGHRDEGYALDWSPHTTGLLASGDNAKCIYVWNPTPAGRWAVDKTPYLGHTSSVEDIQWSHTEANVFASCSADQTIRIWDTRKRDGHALMVKAHDSDVNVISWNRRLAYMLVSGADDGSFRTWDLRTFSGMGKPEPVAHFQWHTEPITSIEWSPYEESVLAVSSDDNQVTLWDLALEQDADAVPTEREQGLQIPPQLLFIHQGQESPKEVHWHPQIPGMLQSTGGDGLNVFHTINSGPQRGNAI